MNFRQLEYFTAVAEAKSISRASRELHVAQPPISRQLAMLEDELGVQLFLRNNKGVELTEAGRCLYRQSEQMFQNLRMMTDSVRDVGAGLRGQVKLGVIYSDIPMVMEHLKAYHKKYPQVELYVRMGSPNDLIDDLNHGKLHVLYLRGQSEESSGLREKVLGEDFLELVMTAGTDPAPGQDSVPLRALEGVPMCLLRSDDLWGYSNNLKSQCQRAGFELNVVCQCYDTPMAMQMVRAGFGVGYFPRSVIQTSAGAQVYTKPILGMTARSYPVLVWADNIYYASCVRQYIAMACGQG